MPPVNAALLQTTVITPIAPPRNTPGLRPRTANTRSRRTSAISEAGTIPTAWIMTVERYVPYAFESVPLTVTIAETSMAVANEIK